MLIANKLYDSSLFRKSFVFLFINSANKIHLVLKYLGTSTYLCSMIQRIQSLFLLIAALLCIAFLFVPSLEINDLYLLAKNHIVLASLTVVSAVISIADIFLFKNRTLQANVVKLNLLVILGLIGFAVYTELSDGDFAPNILGAILPVLFLVFNMLAARFIKKDDKLVRSMDRLR